MAHARLAVIDLLRQTAIALGRSEDYQWGHMGSCNCGFLVRQITNLGKADIHRHAMQRPGDWSEQVREYCPSSGLPMDEIIGCMLAFGFDPDDLRHLERLSCPEVVRYLPAPRRHLRHNCKDDVILYLNTWAAMLESRLLDTIDISPFTQVATEA